MTHKDLQSFLHMARWPKLTESQPTFFSIAGIERCELALSNTYAFFFRSDEPHGLGTLFFEALLSLLQQKTPDAPIPTLSGLVRAAREHPMNGGQWLDLLLHDGSVERPISKDATFAVLIENKIDHGLHNEFSNYWESIPNPGKKRAVVLGRKQEWVEEGWTYITHEELARAVEQRLGPVISKVHSRYLPVLLHFLEHLKQMSETNQENFAVAFDFAQRNRAALAKAKEVIDYEYSKGLAAAIMDAFGEAHYCESWAFPEKIDICHRENTRLMYVVFFGHILDLTKIPNYTITLHVEEDDNSKITEWREYLTRIAKEDNINIVHLPWFEFEGLLVGKEYSLPVGSTLAELKADIKQSLRADWQPLEQKWLTLKTQPEPSVL